MSGPYGMAGHDLESRVPCCDHLDISIVSASNRGNARLLFECHFLVDTTSTKQTTTEHIATLLLDETFAFTISDVQLSNRRFTARNRSSRTHTTIKTRETWHNELDCMRHNHQGIECFMPGGVMPSYDSIGLSRQGRWPMEIESGRQRISERAVC